MLWSVAAHLKWWLPPVIYPLTNCPREPSLPRWLSYRRRSTHDNSILALTFRFSGHWSSSIAFKPDEMEMSMRWWRYWSKFGTRRTASSPGLTHLLLIFVRAVRAGFTSTIKLLTQPPLFRNSVLRLIWQDFSKPCDNIFQGTNWLPF